MYCSVWPSYSGLRCVTTQTHFFLHFVRNYRSGRWGGRNGFSDSCSKLAEVVRVARLVSLASDWNAWARVGAQCWGASGRQLGVLEAGWAQHLYVRASLVTYLREPACAEQTLPRWNFGKGSCVICGGGKEVGKVKDQTNDPYGESVGKNWLNAIPA